MPTISPPDQRPSEAVSSPCRLPDKLSVFQRHGEESRSRQLLGRLWTPTVFDIWRRLRRRADPIFDRHETMSLVQGTRRVVLLMGNHFKPSRRKLFRQYDEFCSPAFAPFRWINIQPVEVRSLHRKIGNHLTIQCANPDLALRANDVVEYLLRRF